MLSVVKATRPDFRAAKLFTGALERPVEGKTGAADRVRDFYREVGWVTSKTRPVRAAVHASREAVRNTETNLGVSVHISAGLFCRLAAHDSWLTLQLASLIHSAELQLLTKRSK